MPRLRQAFSVPSQEMPDSTINTDPSSTPSINESSTTSLILPPPSPPRPPAILPNRSQTPPTHPLTPYTKHPSRPPDDGGNPLGAVASVGSYSRRAPEGWPSSRSTSARSPRAGTAAPGVTLLLCIEIGGRLQEGKRRAIAALRVRQHRRGRSHA